MVAEDTVDVTVAVCGHNAARRLSACLEAVARQRVPAELRWEVLVVDNASTDETSSVARAWEGRIGAGAFRVIREERKGLIFARERVAREARGGLIAFVDDDNLLAEDFVAETAKFFATRPRCGIAGGRLEVAFDDGVEAPPDFGDRFADALACRDRGDRELLLTPPADDPPPGAGMVGRRGVFRAALLGVGCLLTGRSGRRLTSGEDTEIGLIAHRLGWELRHAPALRLRHVMPAERLTANYLDRIIAGGSRAQAWLDLLRGRSPPRSRPRYALTALGLELGAAKFAVLATLRRGHPHAERYAFWRALYHGRAVGYWQLALHDPWARLTAKLARGSRHPDRDAAPPLQVRSTA